MRIAALQALFTHTQDLGGSEGKEATSDISSVFCSVYQHTHTYNLRYEYRTRLDLGLTRLDSTLAEGCCLLLGYLHLHTYPPTARHTLNPELQVEKREKE